MQGHILKEPKLYLTGEPIEGCKVSAKGWKFPPSISIETYENNVHIKCRTNSAELSSDRAANYGNITCKMNVMDFMALMEGIQSVVAGKTEFYRQEFLQPRYRDRKYDGNKPDSYVNIFRSDTGAVCIAITSWMDKFPKIKFTFGPDEYTRVLKKGGEEADRKEVSEFYAMAFSKFYSQVIPGILMNQDLSQDAIKAAREERKNNNGNNYNNNNNNSNRTQAKTTAPTTDFDDDMPF